MIRGIAVLYAEDNELTRQYCARLLERIVEKIYLAGDGSEGLSLFDKHAPDIVITDINMPGMSGLDLAKRIKDINRDTPVIITTAYNETSYLVEAINIGVNQFLFKPVSREKLYEAIDRCAKDVKVARLRNELLSKDAELVEINMELRNALHEVEKIKDQEIELLHYREKYHTQQQEDAFKKQLKIIRDELSYVKIGNVFCDLYYKPLDILSGDAYGTIDIENGKYLFYIIDAMGKGLSASVTSVQSTSFINNAIEIAIRKNDFDFKKTLESYCNFIKKQLLDDEMVCAVFMLLDTERQTLEIANYGMPPVLMQDGDGNIAAAGGNNPPVMQFFDSANISKYDFGILEKALCYSDGLIESETNDGRLYADFLQEAFIRSDTKRDFLERLQSEVKENEDDITFILLKKMSGDPTVIGSFEILTGPDEIIRMQNEMEGLLLSLGIDRETVSGLICSANEMLVNAMEHGHIGVTFRQKQKMMESGDYDKYIAAKMSDPEIRNKKIKLDIVRHGPKPGGAGYMLEVTISDEGGGFNATKVLKQIHLGRGIKYHGRGIIMAGNLMDGVFYNRKGNKATILKTIKKKEAG
jgi:CheY-like chemotaxis protein